jgi:hypothetical protein
MQTAGMPLTFVRVLALLLNKGSAVGKVRRAERLHALRVTFKNGNKLTRRRQKPKVHHRVHSSLPPVYPKPAESNPNPPCQSPYDPSWSHPSIYASVFRVVSFLRTFPQKPWALFSLSNDIWGWVQIMKLPTVQLSPFTNNRWLKFNG